jgi:hypothetical protein
MPNNKDTQCGCECGKEVLRIKKRDSIFADLMLIKMNILAQQIDKLLREDKKEK